GFPDLHRDRARDDGRFPPLLDRRHRGDLPVARHREVRLRFDPELQFRGDARGRRVLRDRGRRRESRLRRPVWSPRPSGGVALMGETVPATWLSGSRTRLWSAARVARGLYRVLRANPLTLDRKSTRLNSSHVSISYAV